MPRAPFACPRCALPSPGGETCGRCARNDPHCDETFAALVYRFPVDRLVLRFKNGADFAAGRWLAGELVGAARDCQRPDLLVAPPSGRARLRERGFNPALAIARHVGSAMGIRVAARALAKVRDTQGQAGLARAQRLANLREAFAVREPVEGRHVAIVDDVMTTGATVEAIAGALRAAGAARVSAWVVARTPDPGR